MDKQLSSHNVHNGISSPMVVSNQLNLEDWLNTRNTDELSDNPLAAEVTNCEETMKQNTCETSAEANVLLKANVSKRQCLSLDNEFNAKELLITTCKQAKFSLQIFFEVNSAENEYCCSLYLEESLVSLGFAKSIEEAENLAYQNGLTVITGGQPIHNSELKVIHPQKKVLIPSFTLYIFHLDKTSDPVINQSLKQLGGLPVLSIIESCRRSNLLFTFQIKLKLKNGDFIVRLIINDYVVMSGHGVSFEDARLDAAVKSIDHLMDKQPVVKMPVTEIYLQENEDIPSLKLPNNVTDKVLHRAYDIIKNSCAKCHLDVEWYEIPPGSLLSDTSWTTILFIQSKIISTSMIKSRKHDALMDCAEIALSRLKFKHSALESSCISVSEDENALRKEKNSYKARLEKEFITISTQMEELFMKLPCDELVPGLTIILPYHSLAKQYPDPESIVSESCKTSNCLFEVVTTKSGHVHMSKLFIEKVFISSFVHSEIKKDIKKEATEGMRIKSRLVAFQDGLKLLRRRQPCRYKSDEGHVPLKEGQTVPGLTLSKSKHLIDPMTRICNACIDAGFPPPDFVKYGFVEKMDASGKQLYPIWCVILVIGGFQISKGYGKTVRSASSDATISAIPKLLENGQNMLECSVKE